MGYIIQADNDIFSLSELGREIIFFLKSIKITGRAVEILPSRKVLLVERKPFWEEYVVGRFSASPLSIESVFVQEFCGIGDHKKYKEIFYKPIYEFLKDIKLKPTHNVMVGWEGFASFAVGGFTINPSEERINHSIELAKRIRSNVRGVERIVYCCCEWYGSNKSEEYVLKEINADKLC